MSDARYNNVAIVLHWTIAIIIIGQIAGGLYMHGLPNSSPIKFDLYQLHKSFGLSVLALSLFRLGWRFTHKTPPLPAAMPGWQKIAAKGTHWLFYFLMLMTPFAGWAIVSASPTEIPTKWFGLIPIPHLPFFADVVDREAMEHGIAERHEQFAFAILFLLVLHVGAALKHHFADKDGVLRSMIPANKHVFMGVGAIFAVLAAGSLFYLVSPKTVQPVGHSHEHGDEHHEAGGWAVDAAASSLVFVGSESGREFRGAFESFSAAIDFDPENLEDAHIAVTVATGSAMTGDSLRDSNLPGVEWFDTKNHPQATFTSSTVRREGDGYAADGVLSIKDIEAPVTLIFDVVIDGERAHATGGADLIRTDFDLGANESWLSEEGIALAVRVEFEIYAER